MLVDAETRPSLHGRNKEKSIDPSLFYEKFKIRYDLIVPDHVIGEYLNLLEIFREIRYDDHADELILEENNWRATDRDHREGKQYEDATLTESGYTLPGNSIPEEEAEIQLTAA
ncbi:MAG: hypothetical protein GTN38_03540 [Candidatus Aenigmarchaeota archaeon]|nr:hypothetical protein [Candidatus Aenigmarchaeota archaeon]NIP40734.1 hypothetical protein [Candidatus Aenigmarchaeota archaeon]NIQ18540.1 hypothetical protein [Candidatus Aenigmarchaeota archaeon]NIS73439.1 hypothetical protein [Candidatus Aenigmarchaeota archaeon]